jgi:hypothetical protein
MQAGSLSSPRRTTFEDGQLWRSVSVQSAAGAAATIRTKGAKRVLGVLPNAANRLSRPRYQPTFQQGRSRDAARRAK